MFQSFFKICLNQLSIVQSYRHATGCLFISLHHLQTFSIFRVLGLSVDLLLLLLLHHSINSSLIRLVIISALWKIYFYYMELLNGTLLSYCIELVITLAILDLLPQLVTSALWDHFSYFSWLSSLFVALVD